jgi:hypothetical protein
MSTARFVYSEFGTDIETTIEHVRKFRPAFRGWVLGTLAFALNADRRTLPFVEAFGHGEGLRRGQAAKTARDWFCKDSAVLSANYQRGATESLFNLAYNHIHGSDVVNARRGVQGFDFFTGKNRKFVTSIRAHMAQQLDTAA